MTKEHLRICDRLKNKVCLRCKKIFKPSNGKQVYCGESRVEETCSYWFEKQYRTIYYLKNREKILRKRKERYSKNPEKELIVNRKYYQNNKTKTKERIALYRKNNPQITSVTHSNRRARTIKAKGTFTIEEWELLKKLFNYTCPKCFKKEPEIQLTADHKIPLSKGGSNYIDNIQPLCKPCNCSKHSKIWFASYPLTYKQYAQNDRKT